MRMKILMGLVLCGACALGSGRAHAQAVTAPAASAPAFSVVSRVGDTVYVSGTLGVSRTAGVPADAAVEAKQMLDSIKAALTKEGLGMDDLVSATIFCTDLNLYATFNKVYVGYFTKAYPSRAFIGAKELLMGAHFEMMGVAQAGAGAKKPAAAK